MKSDGPGTRLKVTLRSSYSMASFMTVWLGFVLLFNLFFVIAAFTSRVQLGDLLVPLVLFVFGLGFVAIGRLIALGDSDALLDFIRTALGALDVPMGMEPPV